jgi:glycosyltransferase involved in cell wall biosynthesis
MSPLAANRFNDAKSDIKFLDYAVFGAPAIVPANSVYGAVRDGETGILAAPGEWGAALRRLLEDGDLRRRIRVNAREYLMQERTLARRAGDLWPILQSVV